MRVAALVAFVLVACSDFSARPLYQIPKEHYRVIDQAGDDVKEIELTSPTTTVGRRGSPSGIGLPSIAKGASSRSRTGARPAGSGSISRRAPG